MAVQEVDETTIAVERESAEVCETLAAEDGYAEPSVEVISSDAISSSVSLMSSGGGSGDSSGSSTSTAGSKYSNPIYLTMGGVYKTGTSSSCWFKATANGAFVIDAQASGAHIRLHRIFNGVPQESFLLSWANSTKTAYPSGLVSYFIHINSDSGSSVSYKIRVYRYQDTYILKEEDKDDGFRWITGEPSDNEDLVQSVIQNNGVSIYKYGGTAHDVEMHPSEKWFLHSQAHKALREIIEQDEALSLLNNFEDAAAYLSSEAVSYFMAAGNVPLTALSIAARMLFEYLGHEQGSASDFIKELNSYDDASGICCYRYLNGLLVCYGFELWEEDAIEGTLGTIGHFKRVDTSGE